MKTLLLISAALVLTSCATNTGDARKDARGRATNAALVEAAKVLGNVAVATLMNAAKQEAQGGKADWSSAASAGLYENSSTIISAAQVSAVIRAYSSAEIPNTTAAATRAFYATDAAPIDKAQAIAAVISTAAGAPPAP